MTENPSQSQTRSYCLLLSLTLSLFIPSLLSNLFPTSLSTAFLSSFLLSLSLCNISLLFHSKFSYNVSFRQCSAPHSHPYTGHGKEKWPSFPHHPFISHSSHSPFNTGMVPFFFFFTRCILGLFCNNSKFTFQFLVSFLQHVYDYSKCPIYH